MKRIVVTAMLCALAFFVLPSPGWCATETGDLSLDVPNVTSAAEVAENAAFAEWLSGGQPDYTAAPSAYLYTAYCPQQRAYWCGPAAVQTALTNAGLKPTQLEIASRLGTTSGGTAMSKVDDVLRAYTRRGYTYHGVTSAGDFNSHVEYSLLGRGRPLVADVRIDAPWGPYQRDHAGHIICVDGFSWRTSTVRVNDSYDERSWSGGGYTGGRTTYDRALFYRGVALHPGHPIVY